MNGNDNYQTPNGVIGMVMYRGGQYDEEKGLFVEQPQEIIQEAEFKNLIVNKASIFMASRLAPGNAVNVNTGNFIPSGLQYLAVGVGNVGWDLQNPPVALLTDVRLYGEVTRKTFTSWTFLDSGGNSVNTATNILKLTTTFLENEAVGSLVEMGLFGGDATSSANSGHMFNFKTFPVWNKPADARLTVTWKVTF